MTLIPFGGREEKVGLFCCSSPQDWPELRLLGAEGVRDELGSPVQPRGGTGQEPGLRPGVCGQQQGFSGDTDPACCTLGDPVVLSCLQALRWLFSLPGKMFF